ncbi:CoA-binding protein [Roseomonas sp. KE2513]|uniref:acetate--CoA ligase family protein n=1 Tax=Roseomonas sp. KE2513 TaxID=2479202 RepID=UPI0018DF59C6|nr:acetate--CoA ligase family protein [Roseomonas sp. KE2513]MBI0538496.1 CoA-binding protein [Roseomonas sp. KE2513]
MNAIARLLAPRSVAVIGASADATKMTGRPVGYLRKHGFTGAIYPVNPRVTEIAGLTCYPDVASLPEAPDAAIVLLGPERAEAAVRDLAARGTAAAIVLASGYGETDEEGARRQGALKEAAGPMRLLGPNTIGLVNLTNRITLSATGALEMGNLRAGAISVVSQSGGILGALLSRATDRGVGFAKLASTGNEADLDSTDLIEHLLDDEATRVIAVYMEGLRRPEAFREVALRAAAMNKPIVVFKVGRSESGARSASSHTGALAGADRVYDALFRQCGVIRAETFSDLLDIPTALAPGRRAAGKRVAILTSTGGAGTLVADSLGLAGFEVPVPDAPTAARLAALTGEAASAGRNPVDLTLAGLRPNLLRGAIDALQESPSFDAAVVIVGSSALAQPTLASDAVVECQARGEKPILCYVSPHAPEVTRLLNGQGIPAFTAPEATASVLAALQPRPVPPAPPPPAAPDPAIAALPAGPLNEAESKALFARFGLPAAREAVASDPAGTIAAAEGLGERVVLKVLSRDIPHKSDLGGVAVGLPPAALPEAAAAMLERLRAAGAPAPEGFLVQEMVRGGVELILGFHRDPQLGPALLLGMGGVAAELLGDTALRLLPITRADAEGMVAELRTAPLLRGYRGAPPADVPALVDAILAFAAMVGAAGERLLEAEINPLFVLPEGEGVRAVDGLAVLG